MSGIRKDDIPTMFNEYMALLPTEELIVRVAGTPHREWFWVSGQRSVDQINSILGLIGKSITDFSRALDFGCGCGRIMLHLQDVGETTELHGTDIDAEAVAWASEHIPWAKFSVNQPLPPLNFPDEYFDLIFNHSVFTHLDETYQDAWLLELERITKPGGWLVLSVSGDHVFESSIQKSIEARLDPEPIREKYRSKGFLFLEEAAMVDSWFPEFYRTTFHAPWYVFERWGSIFDIKAYILRGDLDFQDLVLQQRRKQRVGALAPARNLYSELDHTREEALKLKLALSRCEEDVRVLTENFASVVHSRSWRLTAPLRKLMEKIRAK